MPAIALAAVQKKFGARTLLDGIDLELGRGETWGLIGPGASGKSVLLKILCGLVAPDAGRVTVDGLDVTSADEDALIEVRARIGMLFQNNALFDHMNVGDNIAFPLRRLFDYSDSQIDEIIADRLTRVALPEKSRLPRCIMATRSAIVSRPPTSLETTTTVLPWARCSARKSSKIFCEVTGSSPAAGSS